MLQPTNSPFHSFSEPGSNISVNVYTFHVHQNRYIVIAMTSLSSLSGFIKFSSTSAADDAR